MSGKIIKNFILAVLILLAAAQLYRPARTNPPSNPAGSFEAVAKTAPEVAAIVNRACRDCHSNETVWPWYSKVAPVSWLVASDVSDGRSHLNFSEWNLYSPDMSRTRLKEACSEVKKGDMPLWFYTVIHPQAKLSPDDVKAICAAAGTP